MYTRAQELILVLLVAILALFSYTKTTDKSPSLFTKTSEYFLINLNTASWEELDLVPGIGPVWAKRIVEYRQQIGRFTDIDQLTDIKGIPYNLPDKVRKYLTLE